MLLNFEPLSMARFNSQGSSQYCYTGHVKRKSLKLVVIAP
jgi:hypothetical protein